METARTVLRVLFVFMGAVATVFYATLAILLLAEGIPVNLVSERLGHASAVTTLDIYGHVIPNMQTALAGRLDEILGTGEDGRARGA